MTSRRLSGIPDLAGAPADDPVIAAELARRACAREAAAAIPSRDEVLTAVLGDAAGDAPNAGLCAGPEVHRDQPTDVHDAAPVVDPEAATIEVLSRLGPGATRAEVMAATARLTALFDDRKSAGFYRKTCNRVVRGEIPASVLGTAVRAARGPDVIKPGAAFTACIKRCETAAASRRPGTSD